MCFAGTLSNFFLLPRKFARTLHVPIDFRYGNVKLHSGKILDWSRKPYMHNCIYGQHLCNACVPNDISCLICSIQMQYLCKLRMDMMHRYIWFITYWIHHWSIQLDREVENEPYLIHLRISVLSYIIKLFAYISQQRYYWILVLY